jgi:iron complex transport system substrate-binding protein
MLEIIGAENILADRKGWTVTTAEEILEWNPDVILTNADSIGNPVDEIMSRPGWDVLTAVQNRNVYAIDTATSSRPNHHIVKALQEMAKAVYPDVYEDTINCHRGH